MIRDGEGNQDQVGSHQGAETGQGNQDGKAEEGGREEVNLYVTADVVGAPSGGGKVTAEEYAALGELGPCTLIQPPGPIADPFEQDQAILARVREAFTSGGAWPRLACCYSGCLTETVSFLKSMGVKVSYTCAAHDPVASRDEHLRLGMEYNYPHMTDPALRERYARGYLEADLLVVPSTHSAAVMVKQFGADVTRVHIVPHGCDLSFDRSPLPTEFTLGYLGAWGPDKGVRVLLQAWSLLGYKDATLLLAGAHTTTQFGRAMVSRFLSRGRARVMGWVNQVSDFYNQCSAYCQPSITEGFGIEVVEAMAHHRAVVCSRGAGAVDAAVTCADNVLCDANDPKGLAEAIDLLRRTNLEEAGKSAWKAAMDYSWIRVKERYQRAWMRLLK